MTSAAGSPGFEVWNAEGIGPTSLDHDSFHLDMQLQKVLCVECCKYPVVLTRSKFHGPGSSRKGSDFRVPRFRVELFRGCTSRGIGRPGIVVVVSNSYVLTPCRHMPLLVHSQLLESGCAKAGRPNAPSRIENFVLIRVPLHTRVYCTPFIRDQALDLFDVHTYVRTHLSL